MPLIKSKSKKAFEKNIETEMNEGKPQSQSLAIAFSVKRKAKKKKMADGGRVYEKHEHNDSPTGPTNYKNRNKSSDMSGGQRKGPEGYPKYQEQAQNEKGIHTPVSGVTGFPGGKGRSEAGDMSTQTYADKPHRELREHGKELHKKKLEEMRAHPGPKLKGLASGGEITPIQGPRMTASSIIKPKSRDEADAEMMAKGGDIKGVHYNQIDKGSGNSPAGAAARYEKTHNQEGGINRSKELHQETLKELRSMPKPKLASGGSVESGSEDMNYADGGDIKIVPQKNGTHAVVHKNGHILHIADTREEAEAHSGAYHADLGRIRQSEKAARETGTSTNTGDLHTPEQETALRMKHYGKKMKLAEGGEIDDSLSHELEEEHHNSIAAAIMAKRHREAQDSDSDIDHQMMMAEGGDVESDVVDLMENGEEQPNEFYHLNEHEALDHNFNEPLEDIHQPTDSNLTGDEAEDEAENEHDMISSIRRKMSMRRQFGK